MDDAAGAEKVLDRLKKEDCPIVFITETFAQTLLEKIDRISETSRMNINIIPGMGEEKDIAGERIRRITIRATGMDPVKER